MTDAVNHKLPGDVASTADRERNGTHQVGDDVGGGVAITMAQYGPERTETITAGDHRNSHAGVAIAAVASAGYAGLLAGPPLIGFAAQVFTLTRALIAVVVCCALVALLAPMVRHSD
jgi:MFS family permease